MEIKSSLEAAQFFRNAINKSEVEEFWVVALNPLCQVIRSAMLFRGTVDTCFVHPRDIFRFGITANATSLIIGHNHPSQACAPSKADEELTLRLKECGNLLQIPIVDHVIVTERSYFSFARSRWGTAKN